MKLLFSILSILFIACPLFAERNYIAGFTMGVSGGASNNAGGSSFSFSQLAGSMEPFYGVSPGLNLKSTGRHSEWLFDYNFQGQRFESDQPITSLSHYANFSLTGQAGEKNRYHVFGHFYNTPNFFAESVYVGIVLTPEGFQFLYDPLAAYRTTTSLTAGANLEHDLNAKSFITFGGDYSYRFYEKDKTEPASAYLSDQISIRADASWSFKQNQHRTLSLKYTMSEHDYKDYYDSRSHTASLGVKQQFSPSLSMNLEAGPTYVEPQAQYAGYLGLTGSFNLTRLFRSDTVTLFYRYASGSTTGLGSIANTQNAGLGLVHTFTKRLTASASGSVYQGKGIRDNPYDNQGLNSAASISYAMGERWFFSLGGSYRKLTGTNTVDQDYKQVYLSVSYRAPEMWRFSR